MGMSMKRLSWITVGTSTPQIDMGMLILLAVYIFAFDVCRGNITPLEVVSIADAALDSVRDERRCHSRWPSLVVGCRSRSIAFRSSPHRVGYIEDYQSSYRPRDLYNSD